MAITSPCIILITPSSSSSSSWGRGDDEGYIFSGHDKGGSKVRSLVSWEGIGVGRFGRAGVRFSPRQHPRLGLVLHQRKRKSRASIVEEEGKGGGVSPPNSKEETIAQARASLVAALVNPSVAGLRRIPRRKKAAAQKPARFRVEIPLQNDSPDALSSLCLTLFDSAFPVGMAVIARGADLYPPSLRCFEMGYRGAFPDEARAVSVVAPALSDVPGVLEIAGPRPVILLNPSWSPEEEDSPPPNLLPLLRSFSVAYSYTPLRVQGFLSATEGAVLKLGADSPQWHIFVKEGGAMTRVSSLTKRPNAVDLENALYNFVAANSPINKTIKFVRGLVGAQKT